MGTFPPGARSLLLDREGNGANGRRPGIRAVCKQAKLVVAARQHRSCRIAPGDTERVAAREHVAQSGEQPDASAVRAPKLEVEARERQDGRPSGVLNDRARDEAQ